MSATLDRIYEEIQQLPPDEQQQLKARLNQKTNDAEQSRRAALSSSIRGKYAHLGVTSETHAAQKAEEIALEDRRRTLSINL
jgi:hypothetical protein